jgi:sarcosine oxidase subunit beta
MDFVIAGGGVYGCGVAWELARQGGEVLLLEAGAVAGGASGGVGKRGVRANGRDLRELPLMHLAYRRWPELTDEIGAFTGYERLGSLELIERDRDYVAAPAIVWAQEQMGTPSRLVETAELHEMEPHLAPQVRAAIFCPKDGVADHTATTLGLASAAQRHGAQILENTALTHLETQGNRVSAVITSTGERVPVNKALLLLSNYHVVDLLAHQFGAHLPVWKRLPQILVTEPVHPTPVRHLIGHAHRRLAIKAFGDHQVMISGGWLGRWNPRTGRGEVQSDQVAGNMAEAVAVYPCLAGTAIAQTAADRLETDTADHIPIIDRVPGLDNAYFATGWSGHGWAIAPALWPLIANWAMHERYSPLLQPFSYRRFFLPAVH